MISVVDLATLDGTNGFRIGDLFAANPSQTVVSGASDVNGDGFDDLIIGSPFYGAAYNPRGAVYIVLGAPGGFDPVTRPHSPQTGAQTFDYFGASVDAAGDVNGDGFDDLIVGADGVGGSVGASYLVLGSATGVDFDNARRIDGIGAFDLSGDAVAGAGDVNGDGLGDVIVGAKGADEAYVVFGTTDGFPGTLDLSALDGADGYRLAGIDAGDQTGATVSGAGDVNGDGLGDLIVGAPGADPSNRDGAGETYVVFGATSGGAASLDLAALDGTNGFRLDGIDAGDSSGVSVSGAGDINGDGFADLIVGADSARPGGLVGGGETYVVFGAAGGFSASLDLAALDGANGFRLDGVDAQDNSGFSVSGAGDVNGDGVDDLIIGAPKADPGGVDSAGEAYVLFGAADGFAATVSLSSLDGTTGFRFEGSGALDFAGVSVSGAGDVDGDGFDDVVIGASIRDIVLGTAIRSGESFVAFGFDTGAADQVGGDGADTLMGGASGDVLIGGRGDDRLEGGGGGDVLKGAAGDDVLVVSDLDFQRIQGGRGQDTLAFDFSGMTLDLRGAMIGTRFESIETVDLGASNNGIDIDRLGVFNLSDDRNVLTVVGAATDTATLTDDDNWIAAGADGAFDFYTNGAATLRISTAVTLIAEIAPGAPTDADATANAVSEGAAIGSVVGVTAAANDVNPGDVVSYSLTDDANGLFQIDSVTGVVTLAGALDFETSEQHSISVVASDQNGPGLAADFTIDVLNVLEPGTSGPDIMKGTSAGEQLDGLAGDDEIFGRGGDDELIGGPGADLLDGGDGVDAASYATSAAGVEVNLLTGVASLADAAGDSFVSIENLIGSPHDDYLAGDGGANVLTGGDGGDILLGGAGMDTLAGDAGDDRLYGGNLNDVLDGGADNDMLVGDAGDDMLTGGLGADRLYGGSGADTALGGDGADLLAGSSGADDLDGGDGNDRLYGGADIDDLKGADGDDLIIGGLGGDRIEGGAGNDRLYGQEETDRFVFDVGSGADRIFDFEDDIDSIEVAAAFGFADGAALFAATVASGDHAVVNLGGGDTIKLVNFLVGHTLADLADDLSVF